jgi:hypothetical protein
MRIKNFSDFHTRINYQPSPQCLIDNQITEWRNGFGDGGKNNNFSFMQIKIDLRNN